MHYRFGKRGSSIKTVVSRNSSEYYCPRACRTFNAPFLMQTTRRRFIRSGLACGLGMSVSPALVNAAGQAKRIPIAFQLYTVRGEFARNVSETLKKLAQIGYKAVEFWADGGTANR